MDENDGRRSRVPAGTFGGSNPPIPKPAGEAATLPPPAPVFDRKRFVNTLVGEGALADAEPEELEALAERKRQSNTLVGHPPTPPAQPTMPGVAAPVLAPPKWRGARPYLEGEEPQPRVSSIPSPPAPQAPSAATDKPAGVVIGVLRSKVTTKLGLPGPAIEQPAATPRLVAAIEAPRAPEIDDTIQQMLEGQASVPMQDEEPAEAAQEIPLDDELPMEELVSEPPPPSMPGAAARRVVQVPVEPASPQPLRAQQPAPAVEPPPPPPREMTPRTSGRPPEAGHPAPVVAAAAPPPPPKEPARRRTPPDGQPAAKRAAPSASTAARPRERGPSSSLAPAEVRRRQQKDDRNAIYGILFVAAMIVVGAGGWRVTRGGYRNTVRPAAAASTTVAPPSAPADLAPPAMDAVPADDPVAPEPAPSAPQLATAPSERDAAKREARRPRASDAPASAEADDEAAADEAEASPEQEQGDVQAQAPAAMLTVKPRTESAANLPDVPSREAVIGALEPLRQAMSECVKGQHGVAQLDITVSGTGFVSHAVVGGDFAGTPEGSCIARAARSAAFTPFKKPRFRVIYPFSL